nr:MAG TPA: hypothetical protein [Caudoviricetes sp.]
MSTVCSINSSFRQTVTIFDNTLFPLLTIQHNVVIIISDNRTSI